MLDQHLDAAQACADEVLGEDRQAALPAAQLGVGGATRHRVAHLLGNADPQGALRGERGKAECIGTQHDKT